MLIIKSTSEFNGSAGYFFSGLLISVTILTQTQAERLTTSATEWPVQRWRSTV